MEYVTLLQRKGAISFRLGFEFRVLKLSAVTEITLY